MRRRERARFSPQTGQGLRRSALKEETLLKYG
jgi:hypothetical protein